MSLLQKIKAGKKNYKIVDFPGTDEKVAIVILSSDETTIAKLKAEEYIKKNKIEDDIYKDKALQEYLMYYSLRDKDDLNKKISNTVEEFRELVTVNELAYFMLEYNMLMNETSPLINALDEETLEELKKTLAQTNWSDLSGESLLALRNFLISLK